jgi:hypothetical protein
MERGPKPLSTNFCKVNLDENCMFDTYQADGLPPERVPKPALPVE